MRLDEVNEYERHALRVLLHHYPARIQRDSCDVNLRTVQLMERSALVQVRHYHDNEDWPPRTTRDSDRTWEAWLTTKGINVALMLGYRTHSEKQCMTPKVCELHTPFIENRIEVPSLDEDK